MANVTYLSQLSQNNPEVIFIIDLVSDGSQVVFNGGGTEAGVELVYIVVVERERLITDSHLGNIPYSALIYYKAIKIALKRQANL